MLGPGCYIAALAVVVAATGLVHARSTDELGGYERQALTEALQRGDYELEPSPDGKRVAVIHVENLEVFAEGDGALQLLNRFHVTTRPKTIEREVLLRPGDAWNAELVRESERNLRNPLFSTLVAIVPVRSAYPGYVDLLVVTRDVWSLRTNSDFEIQDGALSQLTIALSENNVLGRRKTFAAVFDMDLGSYFIGPRYIDPNLGGTRVELRSEVGPLYNRDTDAFEGARGFARLRYPLWSLDRTWGGGVTLQYSDAVARVFRRTEPLLYDDPDTEAIEEIPHEYRLRSVIIDSQVVHQSGDWFKRRVSVGHRLRSQRPSVLPSSPATGAVRESFIDDVLPRSERSSALVFGLQLFTPQFVTYRDIDTFDLPEVRRAGPDLSIEIEPALAVLGSEANFVRVSVASDWLLDWRGDGWLHLRANASNRLEGNTSFDNEIGSQISVATPRWRHLRLAASARAAVRTKDLDNRPFILGGETGLRGYEIGAFTGTAIAVTNLELRMLSRRLWFMRWGGLAFWDMGHAAEALDQLRIHHDVGLGLRVLWPQTGPSIYRFDWAVPVEESPGWGRLSIGFSQVF